MNKIGKCGDNCNFCPRYVATKNGNIQELKKVNDLWVRLGLRDPDFPVKALACNGCKPDNRCAYEELYACVTEKGLENCGFCDAYPCTIINGVLDRSDLFQAKAKALCTVEEMDMLDKAFFSKRAYFDRLRKMVKK